MKCFTSFACNFVSRVRSYTSLSCMNRAKSSGQRKIANMSMQFTVTMITETCNWKEAKSIDTSVVRAQKWENVLQWEGSITKISLHSTKINSTPRTKWLREDDVIKWSERIRVMRMRRVLQVSCRKEWRLYNISLLFTKAHATRHDRTYSRCTPASEQTCSYLDREDAQDDNGDDVHRILRLVDSRLFHHSFCLFSLRNITLGCYLLQSGCWWI